MSYSWKTYFIQGQVTKRIKVGATTGSGEKRRRQLQNGSSEPLVLLAEIGTDVEQAVHRKFASARVHGEWFEPVPELLEEIETLKSGSQSTCLVVNVPISSWLQGKLSQEASVLGWTVERLVAEICTLYAKHRNPHGVVKELKAREEALTKPAVPA